MTQAAAETLKPIESGTYSVQDLAVLFQCSARHVRDLVAAGAIPGRIRLGRSRLIRFHTTTVATWLAEQAKGGDHVG